MSGFSPHQDQALKAVSDWLKNKPGRGADQVFRLFGYAGTGKTTLARHIAENVSGKVLFGAFTGKAALVMRSKGCEGATTLHSMIYKTRDTEEEIPNFTLWDDAPAAYAKLIVVDECSMVDEDLGRDILSFGCPVLVLGDPAQLPPVQGGGFFTQGEPDAMLTEVHRQAKDDPIVWLSMQVREGNKLEAGTYGATEVVHKRYLDPQKVMEADQILVGRNATRKAYNQRMRERRGITEPLPIAGDRLVCLRNNKKKALFNGGLWEVSKRATSRSQLVSMYLRSLDTDAKREVKVTVRPECFVGGIEEMDWQQRKIYDEFDYGYVLTVHKSQGSQWDKVVLFDESFAFPESRERWLYTGITRAAEQLTVVI